MIAGRLEIEMSANVARLATDMRQAREVVGGAMDKISTLVAGGMRMLSGLGVAFSAGMFVRFIDQSIEAMASMHELSQRTGVTVETLSSLDLVAKQSGTNLNDVAGVVQKLSKHMLEFATDGNSKVADSFRSIGITQQQVRDGLNDMDRFLPEFAKKLTENASGGRQVALAQELMSKSGANLLPFLIQLAEAGKLNAKFTSEQAREADDFKDSQARLKDESSKLGIQLANDLLPTLNNIVGAMIKGREAGEGFWGSMYRGLQMFLTGTDLYKANVDFVKKTEELMANESALARMTSSVDPGVAKRYRDNIERLKGELTALQSFRTQLEAEAAKPPPRTPGKGPDLVDAGALKKAQELQKLYEEVQRLGASIDVHVPFIKDKEKLLEIKKSLEEGKKGWIAYADAVFAAADAENTANASGESFTQTAEKLRDKTLDLVDPLRQVRLEHEKLDQLVATGWLTESDARIAKLVPSVRELLVPLSSVHNEIQKAWEAGLLTTEQMQSAVSRASDKILDAKDSAGELGHVITTAFEDAALSGKKAIDVVESLGQSLAKIIWRLTVTEPMEKAFRGAMGGGGGISGFFERLFGTDSAPVVSGAGSIGYGTIDPTMSGIVGSFAVGTDYVPRTGLALVHQGERITPASENSSGSIVMHNYYQIDSRTDRAQIIQIVEQGTKRSEARLMDSMNRGGKWASASGRVKAA